MRKRLALAAATDRKRRNQRIAAGVVGIAVFVAAIWIVTSGGWFDRTQEPAGGVETGPTETGPTETGPTETGPTETGPTETGPTDTRETGSDDYSYGIPPAGTAVSTPVEGELIAEDRVVLGYVRVYADGRVIWLQGGFTGRDRRLRERRLTPEGVDLVRSGALAPRALFPRYLDDIPAGAWEDREWKPYVPARYGACFWRIDSPLDVEAVLDLLPASAQALLSGSDPGWNPRCLVVTPEEARSLEEILSQARSSRGDDPFEVGAWSLHGDQFISLRPLFPDGRRFFRPGY